MKNFLEWFTLAKAGLILNTIGAIVLIIGSNKVVNVLTKFVDTITPTYGTHGQGLVTSEVKRLGTEFAEAKRQSQVINVVGYILFAIGFMLQLV